MNGLKVNDFFCGCGGMGLGFKYAGYETVGAWDFDKYAVQSYKHNVDEIVEEKDILEMTPKDVPYTDVWTFGAPCQAFSVAGKQLGMTFKCPSCKHEEMFEGENIIDRNTPCSKCGTQSEPKDIRGLMFFEIMRLLKGTDKLPQAILLENVKGIKKFLPVVKEEYRKRGYVMYVKLLNSKYWGVPQNRERYFVVGVRKDLDKGYFKFPKQDESFVPKLSSILETEVDEKYYIDDEKAKKIIEQAMKRVELKSVHSCVTPDRVDKRQNGRRAKAEEEEMFTLTAQDHHGVIQVIGRLDMKGQDNIRRVYDTEGIPPCLTTSEGGHRQPKILETIKVRNQANEFVATTEQSGTLLARDYKGFGNQEMDAVIDGFRVRKLTPREYARLQGFPDTFEFVCSNTQIYKQMGNAVTVNVAKAIGQAIKEHLEG